MLRKNTKSLSSYSPARLLELSKAESLHRRERSLENQVCETHPVRFAGNQDHLLFDISEIRRHMKLSEDLI
jgi:hypothetical protein